MKILAAAIVFVLIIFLITLLFKKIPKIHPYALYVAVPVLILGGLLVLNEQNRFNDYQEIREWSNSQATIIETRITGSRAVLPEVTYKYRVKDNTYTGKTNLGVPPFGGRNKRTLTAQTVLEKYPQGKKITIKYNPKNPAQSLAEYKPPWNLFMKMGFGLTLFVVSLFIILAHITGKLRKSELH